ncbi:hypothetical protein EW146_g9247 [Bondarzewia mesenterica]|uniref:Uncharacterized protein n=1 Tax=Bondarzewia mesenterica TaxID=1095465 RepID=A0A4S4L9U5_9AGAM|nr:hypothetical protein EW146_g9247 [Bondarzewia mesenterica]
MKRKDIEAYILEHHGVMLKDFQVYISHYQNGVRVVRDSVSSEDMVKFQELAKKWNMVHSSAEKQRELTEHANQYVKEFTGQISFNHDFNEENGSTSFMNSHLNWNTGNILKEWADYTNKVFSTTEVRKEAKEEVKKRKKLIPKLVTAEDGRVMLPSPEKDKTFDLEQMKGLYNQQTDGKALVVFKSYQASDSEVQSATSTVTKKGKPRKGKAYASASALGSASGSASTSMNGSAKGQEKAIPPSEEVEESTVIMEEAEENFEAKLEKLMGDDSDSDIEELLADPSVINPTISLVSTYTQCDMSKMSFLLNLSAQVEYRMMLSTILEHEDNHPFTATDNPSANADGNATTTSKIPLYMLTTQLDFSACDLLAVTMSNQITEALLKPLQQAEKAELVTIKPEEVEEMNSELQTMLSKFNLRELLEVAKTDATGNDETEPPVSEIRPDVASTEEAGLTTKLVASASANDEDQDMALSVTGEQATGEVPARSLKEMDLEKEAEEAKEEAEENASIREGTLEVAVPQKRKPSAKAMAKAEESSAKWHKVVASESQVKATSRS